MWRVDGRIPVEVEGVSGRWFSDDPQYVKEGYAKPWTQWTYVDVPQDIAEASRYEKVAAADGLYGVEGRDFVLPQEWADKRQPCEEPQYEPKPKKLIRLTEITSNVAKVGKVLDYDRTSGQIIVVKALAGDKAVIVYKNRRAGEYAEEIVPIRKVNTLTK